MIYDEKKIYDYIVENVINIENELKNLQIKTQKLSSIKKVSNKPY